MRNNYHYIITGLPQLLLENRSKTVSYEQMRDTILGSASSDDKRWIEWLEFGSDPNNLSSHFYNAAFKCKNKFIREYFRLDLLIRNLKVEYMASKMPDNNNEGSENDLSVNRYCVNPILFKESDEDSRLASELEPIFANPDILKKEEMLDELKWRKLNEMIPYGEFSINTILVFMAKLMLIDRWNKLDAERGAKLFKELVDEVKGSYTEDNNSML